MDISPFIFWDLCIFTYWKLNSRMLLFRLLSCPTFCDPNELPYAKASDYYHFPAFAQTPVRWSQGCPSYHLILYHLLLLHTTTSFSHRIKRYSFNFFFSDLTNETSVISFSHLLLLSPPMSPIWIYVLFLKNLYFFRSFITCFSCFLSMGKLSVTGFSSCGVWIGSVAAVPQAPEHGLSSYWCLEQLPYGMWVTRA